MWEFLRCLAVGMTLFYILYNGPLQALGKEVAILKINFSSDPHLEVHHLPKILITVHEFVPLPF